MSAHKEPGRVQRADNMTIVGISGSPIVDGNTDRIVKAVLEQSGRDEEKLRSFQLTQDRFKRWEDCPETVSQVKTYANMLSELE